MLTILEGSTFCICDDLGDISTETSGFFAHDTRFLSRLVLRIDGARPLLLSSGRVEHFAAAFYLRNPSVNGLPHDALSIARERFVGTGMQERIAVRNETHGAARVRALPRALRRLRGHHLRQAPRLLARRSRERAGAAASRAGDRRPGPPLDPDRGPGGRAAHPRRPLGVRSHRRQRRRLRPLPRAARALGAERRGASGAARRRPRPSSSSTSTRSGRRSATSSPPGRCACRRCAAAGRACAARSTARSPISRRCGCGRANTAGRCSPPGCRGS